MTCSPNLLTRLLSTLSYVTKVEDDDNTSAVLSISVEESGVDYNVTVTLSSGTTVYPFTSSQIVEVDDECVYFFNTDPLYISFNALTDPHLVQFSIFQLINGTEIDPSVVLFAIMEMQPISCT